MVSSDTKSYNVYIDELLIKYLIQLKLRHYALIQSKTKESSHVISKYILLMLNLIKTKVYIALHCLVLSTIYIMLKYIHTTHANPRPFKTSI